MAGFQRTTDHEAIRAWVEEHRGTPVTVPGTEGAQVLDFAFGDLTGFDTLTWEEFFDRFDAEGWTFRYSDEVIPGEEQLSYSFIPEDAPSDSLENETELVDDNELAEENVDPETGDDF